LGLGFRFGFGFGVWGLRFGVLGLEFREGKKRKKNGESKAAVSDCEEEDCCP